MEQHLKQKLHLATCDEIIDYANRLKSAVILIYVEQDNEQKLAAINEKDRRISSFIVCIKSHLEALEMSLKLN